jgi:hypothetical protein
MGTHTDGDDALKMYNEKIITEHSYGFNYIWDKTEYIEPTEKDAGYYKLHEVQLWEGSHVTFGANENTPNLTNVKSQKDLNDMLDNLTERNEKLIRAIKDGSYSDKYNQMFEVEMRQIMNQCKSLIHFEPTKAHASKDPIPSSHDDKKLLFLNILAKG